MPDWIRKVLLAALVALSVGLVMNVYGFSISDPTLIQTVGMIGVFIGLAV